MDTNTKTIQKEKEMKNILIFTAIFFMLGVFYGAIQLSYRLGIKNGVEHTEHCMNNWGKMKHDGWDFYCLY